MFGNEQLDNIIDETWKKIKNLDDDGINNLKIKLKELTDDAINKFEIEIRKDSDRQAIKSLDNDGKIVYADYKKVMYFIDDVVRQYRKKYVGFLKDYL